MKIPMIPLVALATLAFAPAAWANVPGAAPRSASTPAANSAAPPSPPVSTRAPAGIGNYSYFELRYLDWGSSDYFGDSAAGGGAKFSYQFGAHAYVYGSYDRLGFDRDPGYLYRTGVGLGYQQTEGSVSAYVQLAFFREMVSGDHGGAKSGARSYYFQPAYGMRAAFGNHFMLEGEIYSDFHPDFGSRPWGIKFGVAFALGPVSLHLLADHNPDVNSMTAALRYSF